MAGLGEACSHIAAILFYLETTTRVKGASTCTQQKCQWAIPTFQKDIPNVPIKDVDFTSAKSKRRRTDNIINSSGSAPVPSSSSSSVAVRPPDENELNAFFQKLGDCKSTNLLFFL